MNDSEIVPLVAALADSLTSRGWDLATAESCTGGWIAKCCTDMSGSSAWFERGFVTYSNDAKIEMLRVSPETLRVNHAVSREVVLEMAEGARRTSGAKVAVAVTGIAGPEGGSPEKPVGTVWFAWSLEGQEAEAERLQFAGDREAVRLQTVAHALRGVLERLPQSTKFI